MRISGFLTLFLLLLPSLDAASSVSLRATTSSPVIQNEAADDDHLSRMDDSEMIARWVRLELLHEVPAKSNDYYLHSVLNENRYLRPWAKLFLDRLSDQFRARFGKPLRVTSLLRTAHYQRRLQGRNGNAASATGPKRSSHLTGASMDISKKGLTQRERDWIRRVLSSLRSKGYLYAIEANAITETTTAGMGGVTVSGSGTSLPPDFLRTKRSASATLKDTPFTKISFPSETGTT